MAAVEAEQAKARQSKIRPAEAKPIMQLNCKLAVRSVGLLVAFIGLEAFTARKARLTAIL